MAKIRKTVRTKNPHWGTAVDTFLRVLVHEARRWCAYPLWFVVYLIRAEIGMPRLVIRLRTAHPILASVF
jgi:hypothetical protein